MTGARISYRKILRIALIAIAAAVMLACSAQAAHAQESTLIQYHKSIKVVGSNTTKASRDFFYTVTIKNGTVLSAKSSDKKIAAVYKSSPDSFFAKKPGKATITFKVKKNGKVRKYRTTVRVYKHKNPFKKFAFAGKNITKKYARKTYYQFNTRKNGTTVKISQNKGWKIRKITHRWYDFEKNKEKKETIKNGDKVRLDSICSVIVVDMYNTKTKIKERFFATALNRAVGIDEIMRVEVPGEFIHRSSTHMCRDDSKPIIDETWKNEGNDIIRVSIVSYKGRPAAQKKGIYPEGACTIEDYRTMGFEEAKTLSDGTPVLVGKTDLEKGDAVVKDGAVRGVFVYHDYLMAVGVENGENKEVTDYNMTVFDEVMESLELTRPVPSGRPWRPKLSL